MPVIVIIGTVWGDEGKGKIVDLFAEGADMVVRYAGGANAGHTLVINGRKVVVHTLPSGVVRSGMVNLLGPHVVVDPPKVVEELKIADEAGSTVIIDRRAPVVMPFHRQLDLARESGPGAIGTTKSGIGPCYADRTARVGLSVGDLVSADRIREVLVKCGYHDECIVLARHHGLLPFSVGEIIEWALPFGKILEPRMGDTVREVARARAQGKTIALEMAQGALLGLEFGWPTCTSSNCLPGGASAMMGVPTFDDVIGVTKAYVTRVGEGPFPTELHGEESNRLRESGEEYGATTKRPRRCGWLDLPVLTFSVRVAGIRRLAVTKLDILSGHDWIPVCTHYLLDGVQVDPLIDTLDAETLGRVEPQYATFKGWIENIQSCRRFEDLPQAAREYIRMIENAAGVPVTTIGVGPDREQIIQR